MIHLLCDPFPESIHADGLSYPVQTDFRVWLKFAELLENPEQNAAAILQSVFRFPVRGFSEPLIDAVFSFYHADSLYYQPDNRKEKDSRKERPLFEWKFDARFILGDFRRFYQLDLLHVDYLHWFAFIALFQTLPEESHCMKRIALRSADLTKIKNKEEKRRIRKLKRLVALPYVMSSEEIGTAMMK